MKALSRALFAMHDWTTWHEVILNNVFQTKKFDPVFLVKQKVKRIKSDVRSSLSVTTTEDLIRISMEGPEVEYFAPSPAVAAWLRNGQAARRPTFCYRQWPEAMIYVEDTDLE